MAEEGTSVEEQVAKAQERAVQVLERFHATRAVQTEEALQGRAKAFAILKQLEAAVPNGSPNIEPAEYERRRRRSLMDLEQRKKRAMIKNLEYVAKLKIREHEAQLRKAEALHDAFQDSQDAHENDLLIRARRQQLHRSEPSMAGIGSEEQRTAETKRRKFQEYAGGRTASNGTDRGTVAIYVSNLPTDGSTGEEALASVFGNLGYHLRKVHIYYNKQTGAMKGDALVIYQLGSGSNRNELTESVCTQVSTPVLDFLLRMGTLDGVHFHSFR